MSVKQEPKSKKNKKIKEQEPLKESMLSEKASIDFAKTPFLRDLSPYSPLYQTIKKSYDNNSAHYQFAMIETPLAPFAPKSIIEQVDDGCNNKISKLLLFQYQELGQQDSPSSQISQKDKQNDNYQDQNQVQKILTKDNKDPQNLVRNYAQKVQKFIQKKKSPHSRKKIRQKQIKIGQPEIKKKMTCNCKKTKCLKLYCDCFRQNQTCGPHCNCSGCHNTDEYQQQRYNSMLSLIERNPEAFRPKLQADQHAKGCNCRKSGCTKKYCQCFQAGLSCGKNCKCQQCKNCKEGDNNQESSSRELRGQKTNQHNKL